jgi:hypothetical protein
MYAAGPFCRRDTLRPVTAGLIVQSFDAITLELQADGLVPGARVGRC